MACSFSRFSSARLQPSADERMAPVRAKRRISGREQASRLTLIGEQKHTNQFAIGTSTLMGA